MNLQIVCTTRPRKNTFVNTKDGKSYKFNINGRIDKLLIDGLLKCGQMTNWGNETSCNNGNNKPSQLFVR